MAIREGSLEVVRTARIREVRKKEDRPGERRQRRKKGQDC